MNLLEGAPRKITDFMCEGDTARESWVVSLLMSRSPFPLEYSHERVEVRGLTEEVLKHYWPWDAGRVRQGWYTSSGRVGLATAWSGELRDACSRVLRTCGSVKYPEKQHRLDHYREFCRTWSVVSQFVL